MRFFRRLSFLPVVVLGVFLVAFPGVFAGELKTGMTSASDVKAGMASASDLKTDMASASNLKAGMAFRVINPSRPEIPIGHLSLVPKKEIFMDLRVQAIVIEDAAAKKIVWLGWDFCNCNGRIADKVKKMAQKKYGVDPKGFCINSSHTHSAPPLAEEDAVIPKYFDPEYSEFVIKNAVEVVGDAISRLAPVKCEYHEYMCTSVGIHRRKKISGRVAMLPNLAGPVDQRVQVLSVESIPYGKLIGAVVKYACHPVTVGPKAIGSDYPGFMRKYFEERHPGAVAIFLQGCGADVRIQIINDDVTRFVEGSVEDANRFGRDLAMGVEWALTCPGTPVTGPVEFETSVIKLPLGSVPEAEYREAAKTDKPYGQWGRTFSAMIDKGRTIPHSWPYRIQAFRLGAGSKNPFTLVAMQDEVVTEYGFNLEKRLQRHYKNHANTIVLGYSNNITAYLCTAREIRAGGYEPVAYRFWETPGAYTTDCESIVLDAAEKLAAPKSR